MSDHLSSKLITVEEAAAAIEAGKVLWLAAEESLLEQLPKGFWIGGSIPYFMGQDGGETTKERIFATELSPAIARKIKIKHYDTSTIKNVAVDSPEDGFTLLLIPALTELHKEYAENAPDYEDMFIKPIAGWITGIHLDDLGSAKPCAFDGHTGAKLYDQAVAMHVTLKPNKVANIGIVNALQQGNGDVIEFEETGFVAKGCLINGEKKNLAEYLLENSIDTRLPLVADYSGAMINVSFQEVKEAEKEVSFYAPVFSGVKYKIAAPISDYVSSFQSAIPDIKSDVAFSCNCVLNYLYSELEGKKTANITGPMTFGEIAYQLLNQTMVYLTVEDAA